MDTIDMKRHDDETATQFIWRLSSAKDNGLIDYSWSELATIFNAECLEDGKSPQTESSYRKAYQYAKKFNDEVFSALCGDDRQAQLQIEQQKLYQERVRIRDERAALNARLRESARIESSFEVLEDRIASSGRREYPPQEHKLKRGNSERAILACLADLHIGLTFDNAFGRYNIEIAETRLSEYANQLIELGQTYNSTVCHLVLLGDLISGNIHKSVQIQNRENVIEQVIRCSELVTEFIYIISSWFTEINVCGVGGNHSRIEKKDDALKDERLDYLILWYAKAKLSHIHGINIELFNKYDSTVASIFILGREYVAVHGDYDSMSDNDIAKISMWLGYTPDYILYAHLHRPEMHFFADVGAIRCGSLCGTGDDHTIQKRIRGSAYQVACVCDYNGVAGIFPIKLE